MDGYNGAKSIVIAGGGSAGWMTAVFLEKVFRDYGDVKPSITLVESEDIGPIGVGEATVHTLRQFLSVVGIPEGEFLSRTDATLKHGILFRDWGRLETDGNRHTYFHPFEGLDMAVGGAAMPDHWLALKSRGITQKSFAAFAGIQEELALSGKSPRPWEAPPYEAPVPYGYHLDAIKFGRYLAEKGKARGINHIVDRITDVTLADNGDVRCLQTEKSSEVGGDLFIDCTGFAALLMNKVGATAYKSYSDTLLCDRAVALQVPHAGDDAPLTPYTTATAMSSGWIWDINLYNRAGIGYVYSSQHLSESEAEEELRAYIGKGSDNLEARHLAMRVGRREEFWHKNRVSVGLAGGFIEPLESTGLYMVEMACRIVLDHLGPLGGQKPLADQFNQRFRDLYDDTRDFILMHYLLSQRTDSAFWNFYSQGEVRIPEKLASLMDVWRYKMPSQIDMVNRGLIFQAPNYQSILYGMDWAHAEVPVRAHMLSEKLSRQASDQMEKIRESAMAASPDHREVVMRMRGPFDS